MKYVFLLIFFTNFAIQYCNGSARQVFDVIPDVPYEKPNIETAYLPNNPYYPPTEYVPPPRENDPGDIIEANSTKYFVRIFSICGGSDVTNTACGGVIIAKNKVITVAHCVYGQNILHVCRRKPDSDRCPAEPEDLPSCLKPDDVYVHPNFLRSLLTGTLCHNLAVLEWTEDVFTQDEILPIDFDQYKLDHIDEGKTATIIGCGNILTPAPPLEYFFNQIIPKKEGIKAYNNPDYLQCPLYFTTKNSSQTDFACTGDAGGPVVMLNNTLEKVALDPNHDKDVNYIKLIALTSFAGHDCALPTAHTRIADYKLYINDPKMYGVRVQNMNQKEFTFPVVSDLINFVKILALNKASLSCVLQRAFRTLRWPLGDVQRLLSDTVAGTLTFQLPF